MASGWTERDPLVQFSGGACRKFTVLNYEYLRGGPHMARSIYKNQYEEESRAIPVVGREGL